MSLALKILLAFALLLAPTGGMYAATDPATAPVSRSGMVLLVFETDDCAYCRMFRKEIRPTYEQGARAKAVPMHFVDALQVDAEKVGLAGPVNVLPTVILVKDGQEVDRLTGYTGPEIFFQSLAVMMNRAE